MQKLVPFSGPGALWLAFTLAVVVVGAFVLVRLVAARRRDELAGAWAGFDEAMGARFGRGWRVLRGRFDRTQWTGLLLTACAVAVLGGVWAFAEITQNWVGEAALYQLDRQFNAALGRTLPEGAYPVLWAVTFFGNHDPLLWTTVVGVAAFLVARRWWLAAALTVTMAGGQGLNVLLKTLYARPRPGNPYGTEGFSFPSGHSSGAMLLYGFTVFFVWTTRLPRPAKWSATVVLGLLILGVGFSRALLSIHWVSDVLGGFVLGLAWLAFTVAAVRGVAQACRARPW